MKRALVVLFVFLCGAAVAAYLQETRNEQPRQQEQEITLPTDYNQTKIDENIYAFGSSDQLDDLLYDLDLHFKTQGLISDKDAEEITFTQELLKSDATVERCIEFKYFDRDRTFVVSFELLPKDLSCSKLGKAGKEKVNEIRERFKHIFVVVLVQ
jgi:hypothetical protein